MADRLPRLRPGNLAAHLLLIVLGLANVYPFLWMLGTSFKTTGEAGVDRAVPFPLAKYLLREDPPAQIPLALEDHQLALLAGLRRDDGRVSVEAWAGQRARTPIEARTELEELAAEGWLVADGDRWRAGPAAVAVPPLTSGQIRTIAGLMRENALRRERDKTFVADRRTASEYARAHQVERGTAQAELEELVAAGWLATDRFQEESYEVVWNDHHFSVHFMTSLLVTATVVCLALLVSSMLGYAIARLSFPGKMWVIGALVVGMVAPQEATMIPIFRLLHAVGSLDGVWGMILWMTGVGIGNAFLMAGYFSTLPKEVEEAAQVDGAGRFRIFFSVLLPMARPIVATIGLMAFLGAWNNFMVPYLCTMSRPSMQPLAVVVYTFQQGHLGYWNLTNAAAAIMVVPVIAVFIAFSRRIVESVAAGAVKG